MLVTYDELTPQLEKLRQLRDEKEELNNRIKGVDEALDKINTELVVEFERLNLQQLKIDGLGMFYLEHKTLPNIEDPEACKAWLRARGDLDMLLTFNQMKFKAYYREKLELNESLPDGVSQYVATHIRVRKV